MLRQVSETDSVIDYTYTQDSLKTFYRGQKRYELSNHLGKVLAVITDRRIQACGAGDVMHYEAQVVSVSDYYPFGMRIKEREWKDSTFSYRFGFNGKESDDEVSGEGNSMDFGARIYDSRLGRWMSPDVFEVKHPQLTTYGFAAGNPILLIDKDGNDWFLKTETTEAQRAAFASTIENRFDGLVNVTFKEVTYKTTNQYEDEKGKVVIEPVEIEQIQVQMNIDAKKVREKIVAGNPNASADDITNLTNNYIGTLKSNSEYAYLDGQFNTKKDADVWEINLNATTNSGVYETQTINSEALARSGSIGYAMLYHEISEQAAKAQGLKLEGLNEANGYPSAHWFGLQQQAAAMGGVMVINNGDAGSLSLTLYKEVTNSQTGEVTGYKTIEYSLKSDNFRTTMRKTGESSISKEKYEKDLQAEKDNINATYNY